MRQFTTCTLLIFILLAAFVIPAHAKKSYHTSGKVTMLRLQEVGARWGSVKDPLFAEVIFKVKGQARTFGFNLRNDKNLFVHQAMFELLRDAYNRNKLIRFNYIGTPGRRTGRVKSIQISK